MVERGVAQNVVCASLDVTGKRGGNDARKRSCKEFRGIETAVDSLKAFAMKDGGRWGRFFLFSIGDEKLLNVDWYGLLVTHAPSRRRCCLSSTWYSTIAMGSGIGGKEQKRLTDAHTKSKALGEKENGNEKEILSLSFMHSVYLYPLLFEKGRRKYRASVEWLPANPNPSKSSSALLVKSTHFWKQTWPSIASSERPCSSRRKAHFMVIPTILYIDKPLSQGGSYSMRAEGGS